MSTSLRRRDGCHHCGKRAGKAIADHIPPNVVAYGQGYRTRLQVERPLVSPGPKTKRVVSQALKLMGDALPYPYCICRLLKPCHASQRRVPCTLPGFLNCQLM